MVPNPSRPARAVAHLARRRLRRPRPTDVLHRGAPGGAHGRRVLLIDAHAHLDHYRDDELDAVLEELERHEIFTISTAMHGDSYRRALEIGERSRWVLPTFGIQPWNAHGHAGRLAELRGTTPAAIEATVQSNFARLIRDDPWLSALREELF